MALRVQMFEDRQYLNLTKYYDTLVSNDQLNACTHMDACSPEGIHALERIIGAQSFALYGLTMLHTYMCTQQECSAWMDCMFTYVCVCASACIYVRAPV